MPVSPWKVLQESVVFSAIPWLTVCRDRVELPDGQVLDDFYRVVLPEFVVVVPLTKAKELVMVRGYKHGLGRVCLTAPAGYINPGEAALEAAKRELLEETGYTAPDWQLLGRFTVDGNRHCGVSHLYLARHAERTAPASQADPGEVVEVELVPPRLFLESIREGDAALLPTAGAISLAMLCDELGENYRGTNGEVP